MRFAQGARVDDDMWRLWGGRAGQCAPTGPVDPTETYDSASYAGDGDCVVLHLSSARNTRSRDDVPTMPRRRHVMKVRSSLKSLKRKPGATIVRRGRTTYVINKVHPRWKARQG